MTTQPDPRLDLIVNRNRRRYNVAGHATGHGARSYEPSVTGREASRQGRRNEAGPKHTRLGPASVNLSLQMCAHAFGC